MYTHLLFIFPLLDPSPSLTNTHSFRNVSLRNTTHRKYQAIFHPISHRIRNFFLVILPS
jgi:hypothetical protein